MDLSELKPRASRIFFSKLDRELILRPWTVEDQIWMQQEFKDIQKIFDPKNSDILAICRIAYRLMVDKSPFVAEERASYDEDGNKITEKVGGWKKMATLLANVDEQIQLYTAITECIGVSMPEVDELKVDIKKKVNEAMSQQQTGV